MHKIHLGTLFIMKCVTVEIIAPVAYIHRLLKLQRFQICRNKILTKMELIQLAKTRIVDKDSEA